MKEITSVLFDKEARLKLKRGVDIAAEAVSCTLGPKGKTVIIQKKDSAPIVTKDGVTVSKSINLKDPVERMGADLVKEASSRTNEVAGDGTTTSTILTHALITEGLKMLEGGYTCLSLVKGLEIGSRRMIDHLKSHAVLITKKDEIANVGKISANNDSWIGDLVATAMSKVGKDGFITVEDAKGMETSLDVVEGMHIERGYLSSYFVTNNDKMHALYQDAKILITDKKISSIKEILPILEMIHNNNMPLLIIAEDIEGEALQTLVVNRTKSNLKVVAIKAPGYGEHRNELLQDMCVLTGATLISSNTGLSLEKTTLQQLGTCKKIIVDSKSTVLVAPTLTKNSIEERLEELRTQMQDISLTQNDLLKLKMRIAKLSSGIGVIKVGGSTEVEMIERKYRIEDALHATRAAVEEGVVPGGGTALIYAANTIDFSDVKDKEVQVGIDIVKKACYAPLKRIIQNGDNSSDVIINELLKMKYEEGIGYNAATNEFGNMWELGIIDPVKVTRTALENAVSVAITFLTLDAVIYFEESNTTKDPE